MHDTFQFTPSINRSHRQEVDQFNLRCCMTQTQTFNFARHFNSRCPQISGAVGMDELTGDTWSAVRLQQHRGEGASL
jgi:hypothetical protein